MPRCGCGDNCNCVLEAGSDCLSVSGLGTQAVPYTIDVVVDPACPQITCGPAGLCVVATAATASTDCIMLTGDGTAGDPITATPVIAPDGGSTNLLVCQDGSDPDFGGPGLGVSCEAVQDCVGQAVSVIAGDCLTYDDAANTINVEIAPPQNGLECTSQGLLVFPSADANNSLGFGSDGNLYVAASGFVTATGTDCIDVSGSGSGPDPFVVSIVVDPACPLIDCGPAGLCVTPTLVTVADTGEIDLTITGTGVPGDPYVISALLIPTCFPIVAAAQTIGNSPCISVAGDGCNTPLVISLGISPDACQALQCRGNGLWVEAYSNQAMTDQGGACPGTINLANFGGSQNYGPDICQTIVNPSCSRSMKVMAAVTADNVIAVRGAGSLGLSHELSINGGGFGSFDIVAMAQPGINAPGGTDFIRAISVIPPGGNVQVCFRLRLQGNQYGGGNYTGSFAACHTMELLGVIV